MLKLFNFLWTGSWHDHEWEIIETSNVYEYSDAPMKCGNKYTLQCKTCGNLKIKNNY